MTDFAIDPVTGLILPLQPQERPGRKAHNMSDLETKLVPEVGYQRVEQIRDFPPTSDDCYKGTTLFDDGIERVFAYWHPQWGGYCGKCVAIVTPGDVDGCFNVINWHDGEFPTDDEFVEYHYCAPTQLVDFGITVLEKQLGEAKMLASHCLNEPANLREYAARLIALADKTENMEQLT